MENEMNEQPAGPLETSARMISEAVVGLRFDLRRTTTFGPDYNQAVVDGLQKIEAGLAILIPEVARELPTTNAD